MLYDEAGGRARLIDFETLHDPLDAPVRHADDLLVLLLDLLGRADGERLVRFARALIEGYDDKKVTARLEERLVCPSGLELVLWHTAHPLPSPSRC